MKAIILCGGMGTRLGQLTTNTPKPLIEVAGRPFLAHVLDKLSIPEIDAFVLATGFCGDQISSAFKTTWQDRNLYYSQEDQHLGTGGALRLAMERYNLDQALVINGDSLFDCDLLSLIEKFDISPWATRMALRNMEDCRRYGRVQLAKNGRVVRFEEKGQLGPGLINAGVYVQRRTPLLAYGTSPFSFEKDYLAKLNPAWPIQGVVQGGYFVDMGIPEDLARARRDLSARQ